MVAARLLERARALGKGLVLKSEDEYTHPRRIYRAGKLVAAGKTWEEALDNLACGAPLRPKHRNKAWHFT